MIEMLLPRLLNLSMDLEIEDVLKTDLKRPLTSLEDLLVSLR